MYKIVRKVTRYSMRDGVDESYSYNDIRYCTTRKVLEKYIQKERTYEGEEYSGKYVTWDSRIVGWAYKDCWEYFIYKRNDDEKGWNDITSDYHNDYVKI